MVTQRSFLVLWAATCSREYTVVAIAYKERYSRVGGGKEKEEKVRKKGKETDVFCARYKN